MIMNDLFLTLLTLLACGLIGLLYVSFYIRPVTSFYSLMTQVTDLHNIALVATVTLGQMWDVVVDAAHAIPAVAS